jgi:hypothetical protein
MFEASRLYRYDIPVEILQIALQPSIFHGYISYFVSLFLIKTSSSQTGI